MQLADEQSPTGPPEPARPDDQTKHGIRELAPVYAGYVVVGAIRPRLVYRRGRLRGRRLARSFALYWMTGFATYQWGRPYARRKQAEHEAATVDLRRELGREPTQVEVMERLGYSTP